MSPKPAPPTSVTPVARKRRAAPARQSGSQQGAASGRRPSAAPRRESAKPASTAQRPAVRTTGRPPTRAPQRPQVRPKTTTTRPAAGSSHDAEWDSSTDSGNISQLGEERRRRVNAGLVRNLIVGLAVVAVCAGLVWLVAFSQVLAVQTIQVKGAKTVGSQPVQAAATEALGVPMARLDMDRQRALVSQLPGVKTVDVSRSWPSTLVVQVQEHSPIGRITVGDAVQSLAPDGSVYLIPGVDPSGPMVTLTSSPELQQRTLETVAKVLDTMPSETFQLVESVSAASPDSVTLTLTSGAEVLWGDSSEMLLKSRVLELLLREPSERYDVSAPTVPVRTGQQAPADKDQPSATKPAAGTKPDQTTKPAKAAKPDKTTKPAAGTKPTKSGAAER